MTEASPLSPRTVERRIRVLDVGGSHVTAAVVVTDGTLARVERRVERNIDPHGARDDLLDAIASPARDVDRSAHECIVAMPGPFDEETGIGSFAGVAKFASIAGVPLHAEIARRLVIEPAGVRFLNDAVAYGVGEWAFGAQHRARRSVCITLGTGVGSAFLDGGVPVTTGPSVPRDGYAFRADVHGGPLEDTVSTRAIVRAFRERTGTTSTVAEIAEIARAGDAHASNVLDHAMHSLGVALAPWLARFEADELVVGGAISRSWDLLEAPLVAGLQEAAGLPALVRRSELLDDAPLLGAAGWQLTRG